MKFSSASRRRVQPWLPVTDTPAGRSSDKVTHVPYTLIPHMAPVAGGLFIVTTAESVHPDST